MVRGFVPVDSIASKFVSFCKNFGQHFYAWVLLEWLILLEWF